MDINKIIMKFLVYYPVVYLRGQNVPGYIKQLQKTQYIGRESLEASQLIKLRNLINYAKSYVPFYKDNPQVANVEIDSLDNIALLPFIGKEQLKSRPESFISLQPFSLLTKKTTGGSTGEPVTILKTSYAMARELAATWRGYSWAGVDIGDRQARFWGVPFRMKDKLRARLIDSIANRRRCSAFAFNENDLCDYSRTLAAFNPSYFYGYVSMISEYAEYFKRNNKIPPFQLKCIISTSEVLTSYHRNLIETVFSTKVYNEYGCGELGSIAHECECGSLHIMSENMILEILDGNRTCKPGERGEIVVTELNNRAMPLIRYRTGDFAVLSSDSCRCGKTLPVIENLFGREYDMIKNKEGKSFHGEFFMYIFEEIKRKNLGVMKYQVIQLGYDKIKIKIVPDFHYGSDTESFITNKIRNDFDKDVYIEFELVNDIERSPSGKMRVIMAMPSQPMKRLK